jgi:sortase A
MLTVVAAILVAVVAAAAISVWKQQRSTATALLHPAPIAVAPAPVSVPAAANDPLGRVVEFLRQRRWARVGLSVLSGGLIIGAIIMLGYPVWTNFEADRRQDRLERELASPGLRQSYLDGRLEEGDALTRIRIPKIDIDVVVVEGVGGQALRAGAGHYPQSALPCEDGNVGIAGHRTTYGKPFSNLDLLAPGDVIILETPIGECTYEVAEAPFVVTPDNVEVVSDTPGEANLTLTTCHPKGSARERLIIRATMVGGEPVEA